MVKYFTPEEVAVHNSADDCWVSIFKNIFDLTELLKQNRGELALPLIAAAGTSISHWFSEKTGDVRTYVDPEKNITLPYTPYGRFIHVPPSDPRDNSPVVSLPWWRNKDYIVGKLTEKKRVIRIVNMLTQQEDVINTCQEETIDEIRDRYMLFNAHGHSYTWKALLNGEFVTLNMNGNLEQNGLVDESEKFESLGMDEDFFIPTFHIFFNDDLTYA